MCRLSFLNIIIVFARFCLRDFLLDLMPKTFLIILQIVNSRKIKFLLFNIEMEVVAEYNCGIICEKNLFSKNSLNVKFHNSTSESLHE